MIVGEPFRTGREHLAAELRWLDAALLALVRATPQPPADAGHGWFVSAEEIEHLIAAPGGAPVPDGTRAGLAAMRADVHLRRAASAAAGVELALDRLTAVFGLDPLAELLVVACLAPEVDAAYGKVFGYLHDDVTRRRPSRQLVRRLAAVDPAGAGGDGALFDRSAPVFRWGIVAGRGDQQGIGQELALEPDVAEFLLGRTGTPDPLPPDGLVATLYPEPTELLTRLLKRHRGLVVRFTGPGAADGEQVFAEVCRSLGAGLVQARVDAGAEVDTFRERIRRAYRQAALSGSGVFLSGLDDLLTDSRSGSLVRVLDEVAADGSWCTAVTGGAGWPAYDRLTHLPVHLELPTHPARADAWRLAEPALSAADAAALAAGAASAPAEIVASVRLARILGESDPPRRSDIEAVRRIRGRAGTGGMTSVVVPRATWEDLVLPDDTAAHLREFCAQIRHRARVGHEWGLWRRSSLGRGVSALFLGPSGTGKTLAAEVVAGEAGLDLLKIDLSAVVSKYIGETEKNLARVFDDAGRRGAILFFDEADALFGRRSEVRDAHDRYANIEVGFLLQRIEEHDGVVVLASNLPRNIDEAFLRRMRIAVEFPFPDEAARLRIWRAHLPAALPLGEDVDLARLARECKVAGGVISKIVWNAACLAADDGDCLRMAHLRHATRREYQRLGKPAPLVEK
jgi:SpoVK/Ycf46/Vps4 family AAA+-type ATPase